MNSIIKKMLLIGFGLLLSACVHYPQHYSYYPGNGGYSSRHSMYGNYYDERPNHYGGGYGQGGNHQHRDQPYTQSRGNNYSGHQHQQDRGQFNNENRHRHDDDGDGHHNNLDRRSHY